MRKAITVILGIILIGVSIFIVRAMILNNKKVPEKAKRIVKLVYIDEVINQEIPITIKLNGNLTAKNKIELYSEVQGILHSNHKEFKAGTSYKKGETILKINSDEHYANLQAQKSNLYNSIASVMPDIRLDYPDEYDKWQRYLKNFNFNKTTPILPKATTEKEKFFISGRNIYTTYYNVKNMEVRLSKYQIKAPYNGILTEASVNPGSLVRPGQKLGELINPGLYEIEVSVNADYIDLIQIGNPVKLATLDGSKTCEGKVIRINGKVDQASQTAKVFIEASGKSMKEGMYLEAHLLARHEQNAYEMPRKLLVNNEAVFTVQDSTLVLEKVQPVYFKDKTVVVKGLKDGTKVLARTIPGAYSGMVVKVAEMESTNQ
ncbi:MAG: HlyD family efflux transporter periplasmic adaptor subunit [Bacteroidota bacterium]